MAAPAWYAGLTKTVKILLVILLGTWVPTIVLFTCGKGAKGVLLGILYFITFGFCGIGYIINIINVVTDKELLLVE